MSQEAPGLFELAGFPQVGIQRGRRQQQQISALQAATAAAKEQRQQTAPVSNIGKLIQDRERFAAEARNPLERRAIMQAFNAAIDRAGENLSVTNLTALRMAGINDKAQLRQATPDQLAKVSEALGTMRSTRLTIGSQVPAATVSGISEEESQLSKLERLALAFEAGGKTTTGPIDSVLFNIMAPLNLVSPDKTKFRSDLDSVTAEIRRFLFGTAQTFQEISSAPLAFPRAGMSDNQIRGTLESLSQTLRERIARTRTNLRQFGFRVAPDSEIQLPADITTTSQALKWIMEKGKLSREDALLFLQENRGRLFEVR